MIGRVASLWRHPIKAHGREALDHTELEPGRCMPWDRTWAVAHAAAKGDGTAWMPAANFSRGAKAPSLMAIEARLDPETETVTLSHPDRPELSFRPDADQAAFLDWVRPLVPGDRPAPARILRCPGRGMTDSAFPSIAVLNAASHGAVETAAGRTLSIHRWRANVWLDGLEPWVEKEWIGRELTLGDARLVVREEITRCLATAANPATGRRDADMLGVLDSLGHREMGVYAEVTRGGRVAVHDRARLV